MTATSAPRVVIIAGPNGAGKSTCALRLLQGALDVNEFVNADVIAQGLSGFAPQTVARAAGRVMLARIKELASARTSFAFETTLAGRSYAPWLQKLLSQGYQFHLVFLWLPSPEVAIARVAQRVASGGHAIPEPTIRRRYEAGLRHFLELYRPLATSWQVFDNSGIENPRLVAAGRGTQTRAIHDKPAWRRIQEIAHHGRE